MSLRNYFSVPLFQDHGNDTVTGYDHYCEILGLANHDAYSNPGMYTAGGPRLTILALACRWTLTRGLVSSVVKARVENFCGIISPHLNHCPCVTEDAFLREFHSPSSPKVALVVSV